MAETRLLPPLPALRAFEAAARLLSFTRAGEELGMTQAAVSYQIKVLEDRIGAPLFIRRARSVELTDAGSILAEGAREAFDRLAEAYARARGAEGATLTLTTMATFAGIWLAQNLGRFQLSHPTIAVRLDAMDRNRDLLHGEADMAIRGGRGQWPGLVAHRLLPYDFAPMLSPELATGAGIAEPADLLKLHILDPDDHWWQLWFARMGVDAGELGKRPPNSLGTQIYAANAAMAGQGVALLTQRFFTKELASGRLVQPFAELADDGQGGGYWLAYPEARRNAPKIRAFRDWILGEFTKSG
ncbi:MAG: LysR family transcriptional regulator [Methylobacterium mesophilicum]|nr:LysR family transcriptional regulator [Methylobacterium mesophilicum]